MELLFTSIYDEHFTDEEKIADYAKAATYWCIFTVIEQHRGEWDGTVVVMGGAWKGHPRMFEVFKREIELLYPEARVSLPLFEPVVGCAVLRALRQGMTLSEIQAPLTEGFADFRYP